MRRGGPRAGPSGARWKGTDAGPEKKEHIANTNKTGTLSLFETFPAS
jgi:hypothetical protein